MKCANNIRKFESKHVINLFHTLTNLRGLPLPVRTRVKRGRNSVFEKGNIDRIRRGKGRGVSVWRCERTGRETGRQGECRGKGTVRIKRVKCWCRGRHRVGSAEKASRVALLGGTRS